MDDAGRRVDDGDGVAGVIGLHHRARLMTVAERRVSAALEDGKTVAKQCVAIAVGVTRPAFLPEQRQRHTLALQLGGNVPPIRLDQVLWRSANAPEQMSLQRGIIVEARR